MKVWTGKVRLTGGRMTGPEVTARIVVKPPEGENPPEVIVDVSREDDAFGQPRWEKSGPFALDTASLCVALVETGKMVIPAEAAPSDASLPRVLDLLRMVKSGTDVPYEDAIDLSGFGLVVVHEVYPHRTVLTQKGKDLLSAHAVRTVNVAHMDVSGPGSAGINLGSEQPHNPADVHEGGTR